MVKIISHDEMREKVLSIPYGDQTIFSVTFIKRTTGELRKMVCRRAVKKYLAGGSLGYHARENTELEDNLEMAMEVRNTFMAFVNDITRQDVKI